MFLKTCFQTLILKNVARKVSKLYQNGRITYSRYGDIIISTIPILIVLLLTTMALLHFNSHCCVSCIQCSPNEWCSFSFCVTLAGIMMVLLFSFFSIHLFFFGLISSFLKEWAILFFPCSFFHSENKEWEGRIERRRERKRKERIEREVR